MLHVLAPARALAGGHGTAVSAPFSFSPWCALHRRAPAPVLTSNQGFLQAPFCWSLLVWTLDRHWNGGE